MKLDRGMTTIVAVAGIAGLIVLGSIVFFNMQPQDEKDRQVAMDMMQDGEDMMKEGEEMMKKGQEMMDDLDPFLTEGLESNESLDGTELSDEEQEQFPDGRPDLQF